MSEHIEMCFFCEHNKYGWREIEKDLKRGFDIDPDKAQKSCDAYPDGIPDAVFSAGHRFPKPNDKGIQFQGYEGFDIMDNRTQEQEDDAYKNVFESIDRENMTDEEYKVKYGREKPTLYVI